MNDEAIAKFIDAEVANGSDIMYLVASLLGRLIVVSVAAHWRDDRLDVSVDVNPDLPLAQVPDMAVGLFLRKAEGRPACIEKAEPIGWGTIEWPVNDWVWRIEMDEDDEPKVAMPVIAALLARIPGSPTAEVRLQNDDVPFDFQVRADDDKLYVNGKLGAATFETQCARSMDGLLAAIQDIHEGCGEPAQSVN